MADTMVVYVLKHEVDGEYDYAEFHVESDVEAQYADVLDALHPTVTIGEVSYDPSNVLRSIDPDAYREGFLNYMDEEFYQYYMPWEVYVSDDDTKMEWFRENR